MRNWRTSKQFDNRICEVHVPLRRGRNGHPSPPGTPGSAGVAVAVLHFRESFFVPNPHVSPSRVAFKVCLFRRLRWLPIEPNQVASRLSLALRESSLPDRRPLHEMHRRGRLWLSQIWNWLISWQLRALRRFSRTRRTALELCQSLRPLGLVKSLLKASGPTGLHHEGCSVVESSERRVSSTPVTTVGELPWRPRVANRDHFADIGETACASLPLTTRIANVFPTWNLACLNGCVDFSPNQLAQKPWWLVRAEPDASKLGAIRPRASSEKAHGSNGRASEICVLVNTRRKLLCLDSPFEISYFCRSRGAKLFSRSLLTGRYPSAMPQLAEVWRVLRLSVCLGVRLGLPIQRARNGHRRRFLHVSGRKPGVG